MAPQRPQSTHVLEDESALAFRHLVVGPLGWVVRDVEKDYGIDLEVEIFENEASTGLTFKVQLKGMGEPDETGPYRDVKVEHLAYWNSFDVPVLLVAYDRSTGRLWGKWTHSVDLGPKPPKTSKRVRFEDPDLLIRGLPGMLSKVRLIRALKMGDVGRPVKLMLQHQLVPAARLYAAVADWIESRDLGRYVELARDGDEAFSVYITDEMIRVAMPLDIGSVTLHRVDETDGDLQDDLADCFVCLSALLARVGRLNDGHAVLSRNFPARAVLSGEIAADLTLIVSDREDRGLALELFRFSALAGSEDSASFYLLAVRALAKDLPSPQVDDLVRFCEEQATTRSSRGDQKSAARWLYNLGQLLFMLGRRDEASNRMKRVVELDPSGYGTRPEPYRIRGGAAWFAGEFAAAVEFYGEALARSEPGAFVESQICDALMCLGDYEKALSFSDRTMEHGRNEWRDVFRAAILNVLVHQIGITSQRRRDIPEQLSGLLRRGSRKATHRLLRDFDGLSPALWTRLTTPIHADLSAEFVAGAAYLTHGPMPWLQLALSTVHDEDEEADERRQVLVEALSAQRFMIEVLTEAAESFPDEEHRKVLEDLVLDVLTFQSAEASTVVFTNAENEVLHEFEAQAPPA